MGIIWIYLELRVSTEVSFRYYNDQSVFGGNIKVQYKGGL